MALLRWQQNIVDEEGNVLPSATVEIRDEVSGALVNLFEDIDGNTVKGNPLTVDSDGYGFAYMEPGRFKITATSADQSFTKSWRDVRLANDFSELDSRINQRVIYVGSVAELEALTPSDYPSGQMFDVKGSKFESDGSDFILRGYMFAWSFGVLPDTGANLTTEINEALDYASTKQAKLIFAGGEYVYDGITRTDSNYWIDIDSVNGKAVFKGTSALATGGRMFRVESDTADLINLTLSSDIEVGDDFIAVSDTSALSPGMVVQVVSTELWPYDNRGEYFKGEIHAIESLPLSTRIELEDFTRDNYTTAQVSSFVAWAPRHCEMRNIEIDMLEFGGDAGIQIDKCYKPIFENVTCKGSSTVGLWLLRHWRPLVKNYTAIEINNVASGYGLQDRGCVGTLVDGLYTKGCRRSFDAHSNSGSNSSPARDYRVTNFVVHGGGEFWPNDADENYGIGNHGESEGGEFSNGTIINCMVGVNLRGAKQVLSNINIYGKCKKPVDLTFGCGLDMDNVNYYPYSFPNKGLGIDDISTTRLPDSLIYLNRASTEAANWDFSQPVKVSGCTALGLVLAVVYSDSAGDIKNLHLSGVNVRARATSPDFFIVGNGGNISRSSFDSVRVNADTRRVKFSESAYALNDGEDGSFGVVIDGEHVLNIADDEAAQVGLFGFHDGARPTIAIGADSKGRGIYEFRSDSATPTQAGHISFTLLDGTTSPEALNGTTGTDGRITIGINTQGVLYAENRAGSSGYFRFKLVG